MQDECRRDDFISLFIAASADKVAGTHALRVQRDSWSPSSLHHHARQPFAALCRRNLLRHGARAPYRDADL